MSEKEEKWLRIYDLFNAKTKPEKELFKEKKESGGWTKNEKMAF